VIADHRAILDPSDKTDRRRTTVVANRMDAATWLRKLLERAGRAGGEVPRGCVMRAIAVNAEGYRESLGLDVAAFTFPSVVAQTGT
jgi:hypothetical protein